MPLVARSGEAGKFDRLAGVPTDKTDRDGPATEPRLRERRPDLLADLSPTGSPSGEDGRVDGTADRALHDQLNPIVGEALASLSGDHRGVIALVDLDGLTYQEAADLLGVLLLGSVTGAVHRRGRRAR